LAARNSEVDAINCTNLACDALKHALLDRVVNLHSLERYHGVCHTAEVCG
jgi:hypothetical protein